jgi:hypothetical protein
MLVIDHAQGHGVVTNVLFSVSERQAWEDACEILVLCEVNNMFSGRMVDGRGEIRDCI